MGERRLETRASKRLVEAGLELQALGDCSLSFSVLSFGSALEVEHEGDVGGKASDTGEIVPTWLQAYTAWGTSWNLASPAAPRKPR